MTSIRCPKNHKVGEVSWVGALRVRRFISAQQTEPTNARRRLRHQLLTAKQLNPWTIVDTSNMEVVEFACRRCGARFSHEVDVLRVAARQGVKEVPAP